jgi:threonine/homoserine/homoserine lactone efflux protein
MLALFAKGLVLGFSIAAPVGPIGILCIHRTLAQGRAAGLASGLGAAAADAIYGCVAAFGLTLVSAFLVAHQAWIGLGGGLFLAWLAVGLFRATPPALPDNSAANESHHSLCGAFGTTFLLTLSNPMTILSFAAVFAGLGLATGAEDGRGAVSLVAGVFLGSAAWWLLLSTGIGALRRRVTPAVLRWINRVSGTIVLAFAAWAIGRAVQLLFAAA